MDVRLSPINMPTTSATGLARPVNRAAQAEGPGSTFKAALETVSKAQREAQTLQRKVQMEDPQANLEETMVAMQKAQIGFQATLHVRNRLVQAYSDIMNMQV